MLSVGRIAGFSFNKGLQNKNMQNKPAFGAENGPVDPMVAAFRADYAAYDTAAEAIGFVKEYQPSGEKQDFNIKDLSPETQELMAQDAVSGRLNSQYGKGAKPESIGEGRHFWDQDQAATAETEEALRSEAARLVREEGMDPNEAAKHVIIKASAKPGASHVLKGAADSICGTKSSPAKMADARAKTYGEYRGPDAPASSVPITDIIAEFTPDGGK